MLSHTLCPKNMPDDDETTHVPNKLDNKNDEEVKYWGGDVATEKVDMLSFRKNFDRMAEFDVSHKFKISVDKANNSNTVNFSLIVFRRPTNFLLNYVFPLLVLSLGTLAVYALDGDSISDKLSLCFTMLLALFALLVTMRTQIPSVSYTTLLDKLICVAVIIILLAMIDSVVERYFENNFTFWIFLGVSVVLVVICCFYLFRRFLEYSGRGHDKVKLVNPTHIYPWKKGELILLNRLYEFKKDECTDGFPDFPRKSDVNQKTTISS